MTTTPRRVRAFTLMELLIVIAIITLLAAISLAIGSKVLSGGRESLTANTVRALDVALNSYITDAGGKVPSPLVEHPASSSTAVMWQPIADARRGQNYDDEMINSVGWFIYQMKDVSTVSSTISGLSSKVIRQYGPNLGPDGEPTDSNGQPMMTTAFDGWGRPIRYVHPAFDGVILAPGKSSSDNTDGGGVNPATLIPIKAGETYSTNTIRRNMRSREESSGKLKVADSDGGLCPNNRPYFYSAGADGDPSTTADNVYSVEPQKQTE